MVTEIFRHNDIFFRSGEFYLKNWSISLFCCFSVMHTFAKKVAVYYVGQNTSLQDNKAHKVVRGQNSVSIVKYSLFLIVSPWFTLLSLRCPSWRHRHCSPLADGHEGWSLSHWLLVQPWALLLDVQWDNISGAGSLPTVAELGRADNRDIKGTGTFLLSCWYTRCSEEKCFLYSLVYKICFCFCFVLFFEKPSWVNLYTLQGFTFVK